MKKLIPSSLYAMQSRIFCFLAMLFFLLAGCESVNLKRFAKATRIDIRMNPGWDEFEEPFQSQFERLSENHQQTCEDAQAIARVWDILSSYEQKWENHWAVPPESPPLVLTFHKDKQWLGTLDVYQDSLGHVHNLIRRVEQQETAAIVEIICDCASK